MWNLENRKPQSILIYKGENGFGLDTAFAKNMMTLQETQAVERNSVKVGVKVQWKTFVLVGLCCCQVARVFFFITCHEDACAKNKNQNNCYNSDEFSLLHCCYLHRVNIILFYWTEFGFHWKEYTTPFQMKLSTL